MTPPQTMIACDCPICGKEIRVPARFAVSIDGIYDHDERGGRLSYEVEFIAR